MRGFDTRLAAYFPDERYPHHRGRLGWYGMRRYVPDLYLWWGRKPFAIGLSAGWMTAVVYVGHDSRDTDPAPARLVLYCQTPWHRALLAVPDVRRSYVVRWRR